MTTPEDHRRAIEHAMWAEALAAEDKHLAVADACDNGLSLRQLADLVGVSFNSISRWRNKGYDVRRRRSGGPAEQAGERGQVG
jgi:transposase-like protein